MVNCVVAFDGFTKKKTFIGKNKTTNNWFIVRGRYRGWGRVVLFISDRSIKRKLK